MSTPKETVKVLTADLNPLAINWAVAKCSGIVAIPFSEWRSKNEERTIRVKSWELRGSVESDNTLVEELQESDLVYAFAPEYSTCWLKSGPIIELQDISIIRCDAATNDAKAWCAEIGRNFPENSTQHHTHDRMYQFYCVDVSYGSTPLIAAMRCYIASKLGNRIDIPLSIWTEDMPKILPAPIRNKPV